MTPYEIYKKWDGVGLLDDIEKITDQIKLALILEESAKFLISIYMTATKKEEELIMNNFLPIIVRIFKKHKSADYIHVFQSLRIFVYENKELFLQDISGVDMELEMCKIFAETYKPPLFAKNISVLQISQIQI
jgi:hypothetical protein